MPDVIRTRDRDALIGALRAGVVPRVGQHLIQVGRARELETLISEIDRIAQGGAAFRLIIGEYGSGKTFFLNLVRAVALEKKLVVLSADLTPDRRLHASGGQARSLYAELARSAATRSKPDGGAIASIVERFVTGLEFSSKGQSTQIEDLIRKRLEPLTEMVGGYDFATVVAAYWTGFTTGNETLKSDAVRWLRGEFSTRTDARAALNVRSIVDDANFYDHLKLLAKFVRLAGYAGLLVCLDEMVNLYKLTTTQARNANYERILGILNDTLQNPPEGLGFLFGGTPEFLLDTNRGLYSYTALQSRLAENTYAKEGLVDMTGPVLRLSRLTANDFYVLLEKVRHVYASGEKTRYLVPDEGLIAFMEHCQRRIGEAYFRTPRTTITDFVNLLAVLSQNPDQHWRQMIEHTDIRPDPELSTSAEPGNGATGAPPGSDDLTTFRL